MNIEIQILQYLESIRNPILDFFMETLTMLAENTFILAILTIIYWCLNKKIAIKMSWIVLFNGVLNGMLKNMINKPRPFEYGIIKPLHLETATSSAFPSGHTQTATAFWGSAIIIFQNKKVWILGVLMSIIIAVTRLYLGVHWPSDVIGGLLAGILGVALANKLLNSNIGFEKLHIIAISGALILVYLMPVDDDFVNTVSALFGLIIGQYFEERYINFNPIAERNIQIKKVIIGLIGLVIIYFIFEKLVIISKITQMCKYILLMLWITLVAPYFFKKYCMPK
ncbi:MAG: hypothetical protein BEN18_09410 [Epulopiscium sp. Nuni2H_MBin001]|nr:MAG: hypothetical protein BEN18_09410 [Epulopiscium sp. Nuni2H_MBin001]